MSVFYVDATGFGIGEETYNPSSFPIKTERVFGRGDICGHYNRFVLDVIPLKAQLIFRCAGHAVQPTFPPSITFFRKQ